MIELKFSPGQANQQTPEKCDGGCKGCGKAHIKLLGNHDIASQQLRTNVEEALVKFPVDHKIIEVSEPNAIALAGVTELPAILLDGQLMLQGSVPTSNEVVDMLRDRYLHRSKLHHLRRIAVAVDLTEGSDNALRFAWQVARQVGASLEVVYAMDSIFVGHTPSASGFLSGYQHTMQLELDTFIRDTLATLGVKYDLPGVGAPGEPAPNAALACSSKVIYGVPEAALEACSLDVDLLILGTKTRGTLGKKLFGSVSMEVSKRAHCPVLLVPPDVEFRGFRDVLYASNFDSLSTLRIRQAISFARHFEGQLHFVHVGPGGEQGLTLERKLFEASYQESHIDEPFLYRKIVSDDVLGGLYDYVTGHRIDLLVFVTHQRSFWENILHRSITREAVASGDLPMLIIHSDDDMLR